MAIYTKISSNFISYSGTIWRILTTSITAGVDRLHKWLAVAAQTARSRYKVYYFTFIILGLTKGKGLYMASESLY